MAKELDRMQQNFLQILMRAMVLVAVIPIHECAHGLAALIE